MVKRVQSRLSKKEFGIIGIKGLPDELKAEKILERRRPVIERHLPIFKKIEEREAQLSDDKIYLKEIAEELNELQGLSYESKREIKEALKNPRLKDHEKASQIKWIFEREGHGRHY